MSKENMIVGSICLFFFIVIGFLFWSGAGSPIQKQITNVSALTNERSHMTGKFDAKVTMVEFGDYQCPACAIVYPELEKVIEKYNKNLNFNYVFRNFPLSQHANAMIAAETAEAAGAQHKYFEMEKALYTNQLEWGENANPMPFFLKYAEKLGLDVTKFKSDVENKTFASTIQADASDGQTLGINHTPTVFINGIEQTDLTSYSLIKKIDELLAK